MQENKNFDSYDVMMTLYASQSIQNLYGGQAPQKKPAPKSVNMQFVFC